MTRGADTPAPGAPNVNWLPHRWTVWALPTRTLLFVLAVELANVALVGLLPWEVERDDWVVVALIAGAAVVHQQFSRVVERVHRNYHARTGHIDLLSVWFFAGAVLLPVPLAIALVALLYLHRWLFVVRFDKIRPAHREVFNFSMLALSTLAVIAVVNVSGQRDSLTENPGGWLALVTVLLAAGAHWSVNTMLLAAVVWLSEPVTVRRDLFGSGEDNLLEFGTLLLGAFVAIAAAGWPPFAVLMVVPVIALHRTVLIHQLEQAARSDDKTGLLNSTTWSEHARAELERVRREQGSMAVLMIDLDRFKQVNDGPGHLVGDVVLRQVAMALATAVRRTDTVGRYGGDEFVVLLPDTQIAEAVLVAERCRQQIRLLYVPHQVGADPITLSASIGVALHPHLAADGVDSLLSAADAAMYDAKGAGGDEVRLAGPHRGVPWLPKARVSDDPPSGKSPALG